jgi:hypothetical protein
MIPEVIREWIIKWLPFLNVVPNKKTGSHIVVQKNKSGPAIFENVPEPLRLTTLRKSGSSGTRVRAGRLTKPIADLILELRGQPAEPPKPKVLVPVARSVPFEEVEARGYRKPASKAPKKCEKCGELRNHPAHLIESEYDGPKHDFARPVGYERSTRAISDEQLRNWAEREGFPKLQALYPDYTFVRFSVTDRIDFAGSAPGKPRVHGEIKRKGDKLSEPQAKQLRWNRDQGDLIEIIEVSEEEV